MKGKNAAGGGLHSQYNYTVIRCWGGVLSLLLVSKGATIEVGPHCFC